MAYHKKDIEKGVIGDSSKIREELEELLDAESQDNKVMALIELSDIIGSIEMYLEKRYPSISVEDLIIMARATISSFKDGTRK